MNGAQIRAFRRDQGLTQREFAESIGYTASYVSMIERGEYPPSYLVLDAIEAAFPELAGEPQRERPYTWLDFAVCFIAGAASALVFVAVAL